MSTATLKSLATKVRCESRYGAISKPYDQLDEWQKRAHQY